MNAIQLLLYNLNSSYRKINDFFLSEKGQKLLQKAEELLEVVEEKVKNEKDGNKEFFASYEEFEIQFIPEDKEIMLMILDNKQKLCDYFLWISYHKKEERFIHTKDDVKFYNGKKVVKLKFERPDLFIGIYNGLIGINKASKSKIAYSEEVILKKENNIVNLQEISKKAPELSKKLQELKNFVDANKKDLGSKITEELKETTTIINELIKEEEKMDISQHHETKRLLEKEIYELVNSYLLLKREEKEINKEEMVLIINQINEHFRKSVDKKDTTSGFKANMELLKLRYTNKSS